MCAGRWRTGGTSRAARRIRIQYEAAVTTRYELPEVVEVREVPTPTPADSGGGSSAFARRACALATEYSGAAHSSFGY
jgi:hypothetical protein